MIDRQPSRLALAVFDFFLPDDAPLRGDLVEAFEAQPSQVWLWRQVIGAVIHRRRPFQVRGMLEPGSPIVSATLVVLVSFEVVFVTNVLYRIFFGPPPPNFAGHLFLLHLYKLPPRGPGLTPIDLWIGSIVLALVVAIPMGWLLARRIGDYGRRVAICTVAAGLIAWAVLHLHLPFAAQFLSTLVLTTGFLAGGRLAVAVDDWRRATR